MRAIVLLILLYSLEVISGPSVNQILESKRVPGRRKLLGKFFHVPVSDKRNPTGKFEYFFALTSDKGKGYAFPAIINDKKLIAKIRGALGQQFLVYATADQKRIWIGENPKTLQVLNISHGNIISLGSLSPSEINISSSNNYQASMREKGTERQATITGLDDNITNAVIFGAGAALLGAILLGK